MSFDFGASTAGTSVPASSTSTSNLFGTAQSSTQPAALSVGNTQNNNNNAAGNGKTSSSALFGGNAQENASSLFKTPAGSDTPAAGNALFGVAETTSAASGTPGGGLFGGLGNSGSSKLFGNSTTPTITAGGSSTTPGATGRSLFGDNTSSASTVFGASTGNAPGIVSTTGSGVAGGTSLLSTPAGQATPAKSLFSNTPGSTTPAGGPPADSAKLNKLVFGQSAAGQTSQAESNPSTTSFSDVNKISGLFGASSLAPIAQPAAAPSAEKAKGLFQNTFANVQPSDSSATSTTTSKLFGLDAVSSKPAETTAASSAPSLFGATSASTAAQISPAATTTAPSGQASSVLGSAASTSMSASKPSLFPMAPATTSTRTSENTQPASLFGRTPATTAPASTCGATSDNFGNKTAPATAPTSTSAVTSGLFGAATSSALALTSTAASAPTSATCATAAVPNNMGTSTTGPPSQLPRLKNKTMDEIITRWASDLLKYQDEFKGQAEKVSKWDRLLVENGEKIQKLYLNTHEAEKATNEIDRQLQAVESQQAELEAWLNDYESKIDVKFETQVSSSDQLGGPDQERERTYELAERVTDRLGEMGKDLSKMISEINDISGSLNKGNKPDDPLSQVVRVLNGHLHQLKWIDDNAAALQAKVNAAQKATSSMSSNGSQGNIAAEGFGRSLIGRR